MRYNSTFQRIGLLIVTGLLLLPTVLMAQISLEIGPNLSVETENGMAIELSGDWTNNGDFNGSAIFNGNGPQTIFNPAGEEFENLTITNPTTVTLNSPVTINNSLNLIEGTVENTDENPIVIEEGSTVIGEGGTLDQPPAFSGLVDVVYSGNQPIETGVEIPVDSALLNDLTINNPGGVTLTGDVTVNRNFEFIQGHVFTQDFAVHLAPEARILNETDSSHLVGNLAANRNCRTSGSDFGGMGLTIAPGEDDLGAVNARRYTALAAAESIYGFPTLQRIWHIEPELAQAPHGRDITFAWLPSDDDHLNMAAAQLWRQADDQPWQGYGAPLDLSGATQHAVTVTEFATWTIADLEASYVPGDINIDHVFDNQDIALVANYILFGTGLNQYQYYLADRNQDDTITVEDVNHLVAMRHPASTIPK